jgi:hypothetical protein
MEGQLGHLMMASAAKFLASAFQMRPFLAVLRRFPEGFAK